MENKINSLLSELAQELNISDIISNPTRFYIDIDDNGEKVIKDKLTTKVYNQNGDATEAFMYLYTMLQSQTGSELLQWKQPFDWVPYKYKQPNNDLEPRYYLCVLKYPQSKDVPNGITVRPCWYMEKEFYYGLQKVSSHVVYWLPAPPLPII